MSLITRNADEYRSMTAQLNITKSIYVIVTYRFFPAAVVANRDFFWHADFTFQLLVLSLIYARVKSGSSGFALWAKSLRWQ